MFSCLGLDHSCSTLRNQAKLSVDFFVCLFYLCVFCCFCCFFVMGSAKAVLCQLVFLFFSWREAQPVVDTRLENIFAGFC